MNCVNGDLSGTVIAAESTIVRVDGFRGSNYGLAFFFIHITLALWLPALSDFSSDPNSAALIRDNLAQLGGCVETRELLGAEDLEWR